ncbi:hypothetical protein J7J12_02475, partial [bacterium]|nr:hypothetical protein [bacterium]
MIKSISKKRIGVIGGVFGLILLVIVSTGGENNGNRTPKETSQQTQTSLSQSVENTLTPSPSEENIKNEDTNNLDLEQNEQSVESIERQELLFKVIKV